MKADETIASLHEQLANEKLKTETAVNQLNKLQVLFVKKLLYASKALLITFLLQESFNKYSEAIAKIHKVTNTLSSDVSLKDENLTDNSI